MSCVIYCKRNAGRGDMRADYLQWSEERVEWGGNAGLGKRADDSE